jgi:hypothetical protein
MRKGHRQSSRRPQADSSDPYLDVLHQQWRFIAMLYGQYADKKPVMLFDIQEQRVYAFPYEDYHAELSERSQASLKRQYERAVADGNIVVFVRDNDAKKLVSYSLPSAVSYQLSVVRTAES